MEAYTEKKVVKLTKYHSKIEEIKVRLISEKSHRNEDHNYFCEIEVVLPGHNLEVKDSELAMDKAIDKALERMKIALIRYKEKRLTKQHKQGLLGKFKNRFSG